MTTILCTLYNSLYLDKGLVLYDSLCGCSKDFKLYVLCMDNKCYEVLEELDLPNQLPVRLSDLEKDNFDLLKAKDNRPVWEYCWTCTSSLILYIFKHFKESVCTYIDADMYFYTDPQILVDEMTGSGKSAMIVPHWFTKDNEILAKTVGTYCVEFNSFINNKEGLEILLYWRDRCLECCSNIGDGIHWGDQKYLDELVEKFPSVHVCTNRGAGIAPWNIQGYMVYNGGGDICHIESKNPLRIIFIHFQGIKYITRKYVNTAINKYPRRNKKLIKFYFLPYIKDLDNKKRILKKYYGIDLLISSHPSVNKDNKIICNDNKILDYLRLLRYRIFADKIIIKL